MLSDPQVKQKHIWTAYKKLANKNRNTNIPPIIMEGVYISNCNEKAEIFNNYFASQCTLNDNGSVLPEFVPMIDKTLSHVLVTKEQIVQIINNFGTNKADGSDGIAVAKFKICAVEISNLGHILMSNQYIRKKIDKQ